MNKKTIIITIAMILLLLIPTALALTPKEKQDITQLLDQSADDKNMFEVFLAFADDMKYNFKDEPEIQKKIEANAKNFGVLLMPYNDIHGIDKPKIDAETLKLLEQTQAEEALKAAGERAKPSALTTFWPVVIILVSFIIVFSVLEMYRREKIGKIRRAKTKARIRRLRKKR